MTKDEIPGTIIWFIITLAFLAGSLFMVPMAFGPIAKSIEAQSWMQVEGIVLRSAVKQETHRQYIIQAEFTYDWDGESFVSNKVFFDEMVGLRRQYYNDVNRQLLRHKNAENPLKIWVNPTAPKEAVVFRHIRWDKVLGNFLIFSIWLVITALMTLGVLSALKDLWFQNRSKVSTGSEK